MFSVMIGVSLSVVVILINNFRLCVPLVEDSILDSSNSMTSITPTIAIPTSAAVAVNKSDTRRVMKMMKDVGEPYMNHFGLTENDFQLLAGHNVSLIESNFDICASDEDVKYFLEMSQKYGLKVIMNAGSGEAEWGYACDVRPPRWQKPVWQSKAVRNWVNKWKNYPAIYAWDISNEAGLNFPNANEGKDPKMLLTYNQLKVAYSDVKGVDPDKPVMIRMNGWVFYDYSSDFFRYDKGNPYGKGVADIIMINAYSNVDEYFSDFVATVAGRAYSSIIAITPDVDFIIALGAWRGESVFIKPTVGHLQHDISETRLTMPNLLAIAFFKYGAADSSWFLPDAKQGAPELFDVIGSY